MATNFPNSVDDFTATRPEPTDLRVSPSLAANVSNVQDAIVAVQTRILANEILTVDDNTQRDALTPTLDQIVFNKSSGGFEKWDGTLWLKVILAHGEVSGLSSDDHTQYALLEVGDKDNLPNAGREGRGIIDADSGITYWDTGAEWVSALSSLVTQQAANLINHHEGVVPITTASSTLTLNYDQGNVFKVALERDVTVSLIGAIANKSVTYVVIFTQDSGGNNSVSWPSSVKWQGGDVPSVDESSNAITIFNLFTVDGGATYYGFRAGFGFS